MAGDVHEQINKMVQQLARQVTNRKSLGVFSSVVDDRSNSIAVMGGPMAFGLVEQVLAQIDVPPIEGKERVTLVYDVLHADATSLIGAITSMFRKQGRTQRPEDVVDSAHDRATGKLVVTASMENHAAGMLLRKLLSHNVVPLAGGARHGCGAPPPNCNKMPSASGPPNPRF